MNGKMSPASLYDPMPPVFGPLSPSYALLWSCTAGLDASAFPSTNAWTVNSSPTRRSSITTCPFSRRPLTYSLAPSLSTWSPTTFTPFPPVRPAGLTTAPFSNPSINSHASSASPNTLKTGQPLMPCFLIS